ncbi:MAG: hypothetical protein V7767_00640 [Leeuwenhoekiella sp.]
MEDTKTPIGYADDAQINAWKSQHHLKYVPEITTVDEDGNEHVSYVKKPSLQLIQMLADHAKRNQELKGLELMFNTLRLGGSEEVLTDDEMKMAAMAATGKLFKRQEATLKKR